MTREPDITVDVRGRRCPIPVIELAKAIEQVPEGGVAEVVADDPTAKVDVPVWCRMKRHEWLGQRDAEGGGWAFQVRRSSSPAG